MSLLVAVTLFLAGLGASAPASLDPVSACRIATHAAKHIGETVRFRGAYSSDGRERATVQLVGCSRAFGVRAIPDDVAHLLDPRVLPGMYPFKDVEAVFTGVIVQVQPNGAQFYRDDGVRLDIVKVDEVKPKAD